jgi:hypothetical protein
MVVFEKSWYVARSWRKFGLNMYYVSFQETATLINELGAAIDP